MPLPRRLVGRARFSTSEGCGAVCQAEPVPAPQRRAFAQVDVFSAVPFQGNPVAVVLDADGIAESDMAAFARWTNLSETTFVLSPTTDAADYRLRIFTPGGELPFAGHPTLGSAHAWLESGGVPKRGDVIVQECAAGLVELRRTDAGLAFRAPATVRSGPIDDAQLAAFATALGVERSAILSHQWVDNGPGWAVVELATASDVLALEPDFSADSDVMLGVFGRHAPGSPTLHELRGFAPRVGVFEDPVTGSLNASVAQWLHREGRTPLKYANSQGFRVGRAGRIAIKVIDAEVWVGGASTTCITGSVTI